MAINICFFNDQKASRFHPLTLTRPMDDLRIGIYTIREKWMKALNAGQFGRILPEYQEGVFDKGEIESGVQCCWINARFLPSSGLLSAINNLDEGEKLVFRDAEIAAKINVKKSEEMLVQNTFSAEDCTPVEISEAIHLEHVWNLLSLNAFEIEKDLSLTDLQNLENSKMEHSDSIHHPKNIFVGKEVTIEPGVHIIAAEGPVVIQDGATIEAGSILRGPVVIGEGATVKMAARIYGGTTIGPVCKVGGEVSNCLFHSYSNKAHDGFTGNSIFGQWVNLGADTNTSNLKNNYSTVRMADWNSRKEIETEVQFLGTVMGDHSKTAINTMLNTGTICGVSSNIFMSDFPPKYIPSFAWVGSKEFGDYKFKKAIEAMRAMMKRRDVELSEAYKKMMHHLFKKRNQTV